jgi:flavin-binding protein dodecin
MKMAQDITDKLENNMALSIRKRILLIPLYGKFTYCNCEYRNSFSLFLTKCYRRCNSINSMSLANIVELIGSSDKNWEDAAQVATTEAAKTIHGIRGVEVTDLTARVNSETGKIEEYRACVKLSFGVERQ